MSRTLVVEIDLPRAILAVVTIKGGLPCIEATSDLEFSTSEAPSQGEQLANAADQLGAERLPTVVALPRESLLWQAFQLPPAPTEDLPALVAMQAQRDQPLAEAESGFDFLPLSGDHEHPHQVIGISLPEPQFNHLQVLMESSGLRWQRLVPRTFGWPSLASSQATQDATHVVTIALETHAATVWAEQDQQVTKVRSIPLSPGVSEEALAKLAASELRRTALSCSEPSREAPELRVWRERPSDEFAAALPAELRLTDLASLLSVEAASNHQGVNESPLSKLAPLAGLGAAESSHRAPLIDLLHPRRPPEAATNVRTWALGGVAAAAVVGLLGWQAYQGIRLPEEAAADADAERTTYEQLIEDLAADEKQHQRVQQWQEGSLDVLTALQHVSDQLRPLPLDAKDFSADSDVVAKKFELTDDVVTLTALAKQPSSIQELEKRLRQDGHRVTRQKLQPLDKPEKNYTHSLTEVIQPDDSTPEGIR